MVAVYDPISEVIEVRSGIGSRSCVSFNGTIITMAKLWLPVLLYQFMQLLCIFLIQDWVFLYQFMVTQLISPIRLTPIDKLYWAILMVGYGPQPN